jgi:glycosyltransferase involved in cell wall biosynthesis
VSLSVTVICLNEAAEIAACLESVRWADEIVVCDSGSTDGTPEICRAYTDKFFTDPWRGFSAHKNLALERATHAWVLSLDADERVTPELAREIQSVLEAPQADGYTVPRRNYFVGRWVRHGGWYPDRTLRLFRRGKGRFPPRAVHEAVQVEGAVGHLQNPLEHFTYRSLSAYLQRMERYSTLAADELWQEGRRARVTDLSLRPLITFLRMYLYQAGFRDGTPGLILAGLYAAQTLAKYAKLWERAERPPQADPAGGRNEGPQR